MIGNPPPTARAPELYPDQRIYAYLLNSKVPHAAGRVWAGVVYLPILDGWKWKYALDYERFPGWKIQLGKLYLRIRIWFRSLGMITENDVAAIAS